MNRQTMLPPQEHHFYVSIAKFLFHHPEHAIVSVRDPIKLKDADRCGLSPLMLYGIIVAGLPIRWMTFTSGDQPRAFRDILLEAWLMANAGITQTAAAEILGVTHARVSDLKRGNISKFSLDLLVKLAARAGLHPRIDLAASHDRAP